MKVLMAASEALGFAKTGGLADVVASLPRALAERGHECAAIIPLYRSARAAQSLAEPTRFTFDVPVGAQQIPGRLWRSHLPDSAVPVYLIQHAEYFERDDPARGQGLYQYTLDGGEKRDYADNCARFVFFCRAVREALRLLDWRPDILHANDWQTGLIPVYLSEEWRQQPGFEQVRSVFTIHNLAYQGLFWHWDMALTGLSWQLFNYRQMEFYGKLCLLKAGIVFADAITTVSPSYAHEIQTPYLGCGLQGVLAERNDRLTGIVNGVDYRQWNPATDPNLVANFDRESLDQGKAACKAALQKHFGLPTEPRTPVLGMIARLVEQKGIALLLGAAPRLLRQGVQLVVLGEGNPDYHTKLRALRDQFPGQIGLTLGFDERLAHQIEGGADIFLMPSLYEPSGLNQLYSLKYGTVPVVRATGGLADTVVVRTPATQAAGTATGFSFTALQPDALAETVERALTLYHHDPAAWRQLQRTGMSQDWSWQRSAAAYERLYEKILTKH
jgi:starch synthase